MRTVGNADGRECGRIVGFDMEGIVRYDSRNSLMEKSVREVECNGM